MEDDIRNSILKEIIDNKTNKIKHFCLNESWYIKNKILHIYKNIFELTHFLNSFEDVSLRERIFYIQSNYNEVMRCPYCLKNKLNYNISGCCLRTRCMDRECKIKQASEITIRNNNLMSSEQKKKKAMKCSIANRKNYIDRYGEERAEKIKHILRLANLNKKQTSETKLKRLISRKNNGKPWHSDESKNKIRLSNKKIHNSVEFKNKHKLTYENARIKQSNTLKNKILSGEFTPCITNSWTRWKAFVNLDNNEKKHFRSNWDAAFWLLNKDCVEYEILRIPYVINNKKRVYIVDFIDKTNNIAYEIKPKSLKSKFENTIKENALIEYCIKNNMEYKSISEDWFKDNINRINFNTQPQLLKSFRKLVCQK